MYLIKAVWYIGRGYCFATRGHIRKGPGKGQKNSEKLLQVMAPTVRVQRTVLVGTRTSVSALEEGSALYGT